MKLLFVSFFHPESERVGATMRSGSVIRALRHLGHEVAVIGLVGAKTTGAKGAVRRELSGVKRVLSALRLLARGLPSTGCEQLPPGWGEQVARAVEAEKPDIVVADMLWVWPTVEGRVGGRPIVYLEHNVESEVAARFIRDEKSPVRKLLRRWDRLITLRFEHRVWAQAKLIWAVSEAERLQREPRWQGKTFVVRNSLPDDQEPVEAGRAVRFDALFAGAASFLPNRVGLEWFCTQVWREHNMGEAGWSFGVLGGRGAPLAATRLPGVEWLGYVADLAPLYRSTRAVIAPIFTGGGTKLKVLEALQYGLPVVAAPHAVEGLDSGHAIQVVHTPAEWVAALERIRVSDTTAESRQNREFYLRHHDWRALARVLEASLRTL